MGRRCKRGSTGLQGGWPAGELPPSHQARPAPSWPAPHLHRNGVQLALDGLKHLWRRPLLCLLLLARACLPRLLLLPLLRLRRQRGAHHAAQQLRQAWGLRRRLLRARQLALEKEAAGAALEDFKRGGRLLLRWRRGALALALQEGVAFSNALLRPGFGQAQNQGSSGSAGSLPSHRQLSWPACRPLQQPLQRRRRTCSCCTHVASPLASAAGTAD